jgi:hypothetical protein
MSKPNGVSEPVALVLEGITLLALGIWWPKKKNSKPRHARLDRRSGAPSPFRCRTIGSRMTRVRPRTNEARGHSTAQSL